MSEIYIAKEGERLDKVVYKHYKSLEYFDQVLSCNKHLNAVLGSGDKIFLPKIEKKEIKEEALW